jgi:hypothetical protein
MENDYSWQRFFEGDFDDIVLRKILKQGFSF